MFSPSSPDYRRVLDAFRQVLKHHAGQENRIQQLEAQLQALADCRSPCRYDSEEKEHITTHLEDRIEDQMYSVHRELEGTLLTETEDRVAETVELKHEELRKEIEDEWVDDIRHDVSAQLRDQIKKDILKDLVQALVKAYKGGGDEDESPRKKMLRKFKGGPGSSSISTASTASTQSQSTTLSSAMALATATVSKKLSTVSETTSSPKMPGELAFQTAIEDVQKRYGGKLSAEEVMRVLDFLGANLMEAVKYNGCGAELKWLYVQRWAKAKVKGEE